MTTMMTRTHEEIVEGLRDTLELLGDESHWTQGAMARTAKSWNCPEGDSVLSGDEHATSWCLFGAIELMMPLGLDLTIANDRFHIEVNRKRREDVWAGMLDFLCRAYLELTGLTALPTDKNPLAEHPLVKYNDANSHGDIVLLVKHAFNMAESELSG